MGVDFWIQRPNTEVSREQRDSRDAEKLLRYSIQKGYFNQLHFELGNEPDLKQSKSWINLDGVTIGKDFQTLRSLLNGPEFGPYFHNSLLLGPDVANPTDQQMSVDFLNVAGDVISGMTWHNYYGGSELKYVSNYTDPVLLDSFFNPLNSSLAAIADSKYPNTKAWIGETSSTYAPPGSDINMSYVAGFMLLDKMGLSASAGIELFVRQTFYGFWFGVVDQALYPTPNYWISLLYKRLVGSRVLHAEVIPVQNVANAREVRFYAHCLPRTTGAPPGAVTLYGMNLLDTNVTLQLDQTYTIDKYLLTPGGWGGLTSRFISLNNKIIVMPDDKNLPDLQAETTAATSLLMPAKSMGFYVLSDANAEACK